MFACDVDGVVADFAEGFSRLLNNLDGRDSKLPIILGNKSAEWDWNKWYAPDIISRPDLKNLIEEAWEGNIKKKGNVLWSGLKPLFPDSMQMLNIVAREAPIVFMSRRDGPGAWQETSAWLHRYGVDDPMVYIIKPGEEKSDICKRMGIKTIIDDSPNYALLLLLNKINVIMPMWDYNKEFREERWMSQQLFPVSNLNEALIQGIRGVKIW